jgi:hypothetical protein
MSQQQAEQPQLLLLHLAAVAEIEAYMSVTLN